MGQRANLIIVQYGEYELFYTHWAANTLTRDLFWSPEFATAFIQIQREVDKESGWLDEVWAEGGALVDCDNEVFLLFGGEDMLWNVPLRRFYLKLLKCIWHGWTIRWAYEGIADLADYVNYPRGKVLAKQTSDPEIDSRPDKNYNKCDLSPPKEKSWTDVVIGVVFADNSIGLFPLMSDMEHLLHDGSLLAEEVVNQRKFALNEILLHDWIKEFPWGGIHIDIAAKNLEFWITNQSIEIVDRIKPYWSDWNIIFHQDNFEFQELITNNRLQFPKPSDRILRQNIETILLGESGRSPVDELLELSEKDRQVGNDVKINPWALRDDRIELDLLKRREILNLAFARVLKD